MIVLAPSVGIGNGEKDGKCNEQEVVRFHRDSAEVGKTVPNFNSVRRR
jgi:hypothetical protein